MDRRNICKMGLAGIGTMAFSRPVRAMESYLKASEKKKWAILYGSRCGSTREYAGYINEGLGEIADVVDIAETTPDVSDYEFFIIGGWRSGQNLMPASIPNFVKNNKDALKDKIQGFFSVQGNGGNTRLEPAHTSFLNSKLVELSGVTDKPAKVLWGRNDHSCSNLSMIPEYDNVSKEDGVAFGKEIQATAMRTMQPAYLNRFELYQNSPNPFNPITTIRYSIPQTADVMLTVCALDGRRMVTLFSGVQAAGTYDMVWDGSRLAPGYYLYQLDAGGLRKVRRSRRIGR